MGAIDLAVFVLFVALAVFWLTVAGWVARRRRVPRWHFRAGFVPPDAGRYLLFCVLLGVGCVVAAPALLLLGLRDQDVLLGEAGNTVLGALVALIALALVFLGMIVLVANTRRSPR